jgi:hypothetical protein
VAYFAVVRPSAKRAQPERAGSNPSETTIGEAAPQRQPETKLGYRIDPLTAPLRSQDKINANTAVGTPVAIEKPKQPDIQGDAEVKSSGSSHEITNDTRLDVESLAGYSAAQEYAAVASALRSDNYLGAQIALNDFTTIPEDCAPFVRPLANAWMHRYEILTDNLKGLKSSLKVLNPVTGELSKVLSASASGLMLEQGVGSHVVPWNQLPASDVTKMWSDLAELVAYSGEPGQVALMHSVLETDFIKARTTVKRLANAKMNAMNASPFIANIERWTILQWLKEVQVARDSGDASTARARVYEIRRVVDLGGHEWADSVLRHMALEMPEQTVATKPQLTTAITADFSGWQGVQLAGAWESAAHGWRTSGDSSLRADNIGDFSRVDFTFVPKKYAGTLRVAVGPLDVILNFDQSSLSARASGGGSAIENIPVTLFPRQRNTLKVWSNHQNNEMRIDVNRDLAVAIVKTRIKANELGMLFPAGSDVVVLDIGRSQ